MKVTQASFGLSSLTPAVSTTPYSPDTSQAMQIACTLRAEQSEQHIKLGAPCASIPRVSRTVQKGDLCSGHYTVLIFQAKCSLAFTFHGEEAHFLLKSANLS